VKDDKKVSFRIDCDCHTEILDLTYYLDDEPRIYYLTIYKASAGFGLWWRLKHAIKYFLYGEFHGNSIVLQKPEYDYFVYILDAHKTIESYTYTDNRNTR